MAARITTTYTTTTRLGIYVDAWDKYTHDIDVYSNRVENTANDGIALVSEMGGLLQRVRVHNNVSWGNRFVGINLGAAGGVPTHPMRDIEIVNNTMVGNGIGEWGGGIAVDANVISGIVLRNNIVSGNLTFQIVIGSHVNQNAIAIDHNLIDGFRGDAGEVMGRDFIQDDPRFVDVGRAITAHARIARGRRGLAGPRRRSADGRPRPAGGCGHRRVRAPPRAAPRDTALMPPALIVAPHSGDVLRSRRQLGRAVQRSRERAVRRNRSRVCVGPSFRAAAARHAAHRRGRHADHRSSCT
jgi:hypothetical protein